MFQYSDSESKDSDEGIRFKTDSTRNNLNKEDLSASRSKRRYRRSRSSSRKNRDSRRSSDGERSRRRSSKTRKHTRKSRRSLSSDRSPPRKDNSVTIVKQNEEYSREGVSQTEKIEETIEMGPALPPHLMKSSRDEDQSLKEKKETSEETPYIGPQLPPHLLNKKDTVEQFSRIGPHLPSDLRLKLDSNMANLSENSDDEVYGPLPVGQSNYSKAQIALEERALQLKMDQLGPGQDKVPTREEWMLELPEVKAANLGLGPRQFRNKAGPDLSDRSSWTDTPDKKKVKNEEVDLKKETELREIQRRDEEQERMSKKHKKKNNESLLELHQNKMKKKKKEEGGPSERRPFSRDTDLQVNRFDEAQKKAILKKAQLLDDRFSSGQSKFL